MAARRPPTGRQRRLGAELRKMREYAGLSLTQAATLHGTDRTTVSNVESARFGVSDRRVRAWAAGYSCRDRAYVDALARVARERRTPAAQWWDEYRDALAATAMDLAELEHHAPALRTAQITHMPGLLQHEKYARAVFAEAVPPLSPEDLEHELAFRLRRSSLLDRPRPPHCTFLVHETALRMRFGGKTVMKRQLGHLLEQSERDAVSLHVVPFAAGGLPTTTGATLYACGPVERLDTVQTDTPVGLRFVHADTDLTKYRALMRRWEERALGAADSRRFIRTVAQQL